MRTPGRPTRLRAPHRRAPLWPPGAPAGGLLLMGSAPSWPHSPPPQCPALTHTLAGPKAARSETAHAHRSLLSWTGGGGGQKVLPVGLTPPTHLLRAASRPQKLQVRPPPLALSTTIGHLPPSQDALGFLSLPPVFPNLPFTSAPTSTCWGSTSRRPLGCSGLFRLPAPLPPGIHGRDVSMALLTAPPGSPVLFGRPQGLALITGHKGSQISLQPRLLPEMQDSRTQVPTEQLHWV